MDTIYLREMTSKEIKLATEKNAVLLIPFGQTEEHGNFLPVGSDTLIVEHVIEATVRKAQGKVPALIAPSIQYGYSNEIMKQWPGTFVVRPQVLIDLLIDICKSAVDMGFKKIAIVNGHGHHTEICKVAIRQLFDITGINVVMVQPHMWAGDVMEKLGKSGPGASCHGGEFETSLLKHLGYCDEEVTDANPLKHKSKYISSDGLGGEKAGAVFWSTWGLQKSKTGIYGDPRLASAETGKALVESVSADFAEFLEELFNWTEPEKGDCI